jgi:phosphatidylglycerol:prolipoprotein diacylglycerol transferase
LNDYADAAGIVISLDPVLLRVGPASLRWYGLLLAVGLACGIAIALRAGRRRGIAEDTVWSAALVAIVGGFAGGRILHVVDKLDYYVERTDEIIRLGPGGLSMAGAVLGGALALAIFARVRHEPLAPLLSVAAWGVLLGQIVGRLGSLVNGDSWGAPTDLPFGIVYTHPDAALPPSLVGVATQPYVIYEMLWNLVALGVLGLLVKRRASAMVQSTLAFVLFGLGRLALGGLRQESVVVFGLQQAQVVAAGILLLSLPYLVYLLTVKPRAATEEAADFARS